MPSIKSIGKKSKDKWTANDVYVFWCNEYEKHQKQEYVPYLYKQREISILKELLEEYDIYTLLVNIQALIEDSNRSTSIGFLPNDIDP